VLAPPRGGLRRRAPLILAGLILVLAVVEATNALVAPALAPRAADWKAAEATVRAGWKAGDLIVAAPAWSDQVLREYLGDLLPIELVGRLDHRRFGRVWEVAQRGARAPETDDGKVVAAHAHGPLRVRLVERRASPVVYDFGANWQRATGKRSVGGAHALPCDVAGDRIQCATPTSDTGFSWIMPRLLEIDFQLRRALYVVGSPSPSSQPTLVYLDFPGVSLGRELAVGAGMANAWWREVGPADAEVTLRVLVGGNEIGRVVSNNRSGWRVLRLDTAAHAGQTLPVRFEVSSPKPYGRHFGFAAEARNPP
jgi:hypothetical protein